MQRIAINNTKYRLLQTLLGLAICMVFVGCQHIAAPFKIFDEPPTVEAKYVLPDRKTVVLVDDAKSALGNPALARQMGATAVYYMRENKVFKEATFIDPQKVANYESELGNRWHTTPITEVGRALGAEQVVYARVTQVSTVLGNGLYQPKMQLEVKVVGVDGKRLWPADELNDPNNQPPSHTLRVELRYEYRETASIGDATPDDMTRKLADEAGLALARLFYAWKMPEPGADL